MKNLNIATLCVVGALISDLALAHKPTTTSTLTTVEVAQPTFSYVYQNGVNPQPTPYGGYNQPLYSMDAGYMSDQYMFQQGPENTQDPFDQTDPLMTDNSFDQRDPSMTDNIFDQTDPMTDTIFDQTDPMTDTTFDQTDPMTDNSVDLTDQTYPEVSEKSVDLTDPSMTDNSVDLTDQSQMDQNLDINDPNELTETNDLTDPNESSETRDITDPTMSPKVTNVQKKNPSKPTTDPMADPTTSMDTLLSADPGTENVMDNLMNFNQSTPDTKAPSGLDQPLDASVMDNLVNFNQSTPDMKAPSGIDQPLDASVMDNLMNSNQSTPDMPTKTGIDQMVVNPPSKNDISVILRMLLVPNSVPKSGTDGTTQLHLFIVQLQNTPQIADFLKFIEALLKLIKSSELIPESAKSTSLDALVPLILSRQPNRSAPVISSITLRLPASVSGPLNTVLTLIVQYPDWIRRIPEILSDRPLVIALNKLPTPLRIADILNTLGFAPSSDSQMNTLLVALISGSTPTSSGAPLTPISSVLAATAQPTGVIPNPVGPYAPPVITQTTTTKCTSTQPTFASLPTYAAQTSPQSQMSSDQQQAPTLDTPMPPVVCLGKSGSSKPTSTDPMTSDPVPLAPIGNPGSSKSSSPDPATLDPMPLVASDANGAPAELGQMTPGSNSSDTLNLVNSSMDNSTLTSASTSGAFESTPLWTIGAGVLAVLVL